MIADKKKKKVSKKSKRAWRKHTNVEDIENFLEEKRADQRLGVDQLSSRKDAELFMLDVEGSDPSKSKGRPRTKAEKKQWANEPSRYQLALIPQSAVQDPIKRNRVRTKEERKHPARKAKDLQLLSKGSMRKKAREALENRKQSLKNNKKQLAKQRLVKFNSDIWSNEIESKVDDSWLGEDAKTQALKTVGEFKVKPPRDLKLPRSNLPKVEPPHPGISYNPSLADHKDLISQVVDKEVEMMKADAHIARVTAPFKRRKNKQSSDWVEEILQGLGIGTKEEKVEEEIKKEEENEDDIKEESKANIVVKKQPKMKTKKQRRAQKRLKEEAQQRKHKATEKKKTSDILQLKNIVSNLDASDTRNEEKSKVKHQAKLDHARTGTKRLARIKYTEPLEDFTSSMELTGSLRKLKARQTLLRDRFNSMQKRNMLQPTTRIFKTKKRKVKVYIKRTHRIEELPSKKPAATNKIKIINKV